MLYITKIAVNQKKLSKLVEQFARYQSLYFGPSVGIALHLLNNFFASQVFVKEERWLK